MNEINEVFKHAMCLFIPTSTNKNEVPGLGIGFSNRDLPFKATKLLKSIGTDFAITLDIVDIRIRIRASEEKKGEIAFDIFLNFDEIEVEKFKSFVPNGSRGFFAFGVFENCQFYIVNNSDNFAPFNATSIIFTD